MPISAQALKIFEKWYASLPVQKQHGCPARGTIATALVVLERLKSQYDLRLDAHRSERGKSQLIGASGAAVSKILAKFGETRPFLVEGGRTNRGGPGAIDAMLKALDAAKLTNLAVVERNQALEDLQRFLVGKVAEFHSRQRLKFNYDSGKSTWQCIHELLGGARETGKEGPVAQYLVGAKLELRFPDIEIRNESYSTADDPSGRPGDFDIGDTVFHVTVAPMSGVYEKCKRNVREGFRVYLLVPDRSLIGARQNVEAILPGQVTTESIESFVAQNVEELSGFAKNKLADGFRKLLETYNKRVDVVENDKSMLIQLPRNLQS